MISPASHSESSVNPTRDPREWFDLGSDDYPALGFIEVDSIASGLVLTDVVTKKAPVQVIASQPVSSGKHVLLFFGDVASVQESFEAARESGGSSILKQIQIPNVHNGLIPFLDSLWVEQASSATHATIDPDDSIGIVESSMLAGAIIAADQALKTAKTSLCRLRLGQGIGGKAYFILVGKQEEVEASIEAAQVVLTQLECLIRVEAIVRPQSDILTYF